MKRKLVHIETLIYYDGPQLALAQDQLSSFYICMQVPNSDDQLRFLCVPISQRRLEEFYSGQHDLKKILENPETDELFVAESGQDTYHEMLLVPIPLKDVPEGWWPEEGIVLDPDEYAAREVIDQAAFRNRAVIQLSLNPADSSAEHKINSMTLSVILSAFQYFLSQAYTKAISSLPRAEKKKYIGMDNAQTEVYASAPGSFVLHIQSKHSADFYGYAELSRALHKVDEITERSQDVEATMDILKTYRGHLVNAYKKLLHAIAINNVPINYHWAMPESRIAVHRQISVAHAVAIYDKLKDMYDLSTEEVTFKGTIVRVNVAARTWTVFDIEDQHDYSGRVRDESELSLFGITVGSKLYTLNCDEEMKQDSTGKEKRLFWLKSYAAVSDDNSNDADGMLKI